MSIKKKDWETLRDELIEKDKAEYLTDKDNWDFFLQGNTLKSSFEDIESDERLATVMEIHYGRLIRNKHITKETVEKYSDFFDRTGLETDLDKVIAEQDKEFAWTESFGERVPPIYPPKARKNLCREYRRNSGEQLKAMRVKRGYSLRQVEEKTGIARNIISRTEAGRANTTIDTLAILVDFYEIGIPLEISKFTPIYPIQELDI